jgi:hypothetical protein
LISSQKFLEIMSKCEIRMFSINASEESQLRKFRMPISFDPFKLRLSDWLGVALVRDWAMKEFKAISFTDRTNHVRDSESKIVRCDCDHGSNHCTLADH